MIGSALISCDESMIRGAQAGARPCAERAKPWVLAATIVGSSMAFIDSSVVNVALPAIQADLAAPMREAQWVVNAYMLMLGALILVGGAAGDRFGRRRDVRDRHRCLHGRFRCLRLGAECGRVDRGQSCSRCRWRAAGSRQSCDHQCGVPGARARPRHRHMGRRLRAHDGVGSGDRRVARRRLVVANHFSDQCADRSGRRRARDLASARESPRIRRRGGRLGWRCACRRRARRAGVWIDARIGDRVDAGGRAGFARRRDRHAGLVPVARGPRAYSNDAA